MSIKKNKIIGAGFLIFCAATLLFSCDEYKITSVEILGDKVITMNIGQKDTLELNVQPLKNYIYNPVYWRSSNPNVADVDGYGVVTAIYSGTCTITATIGNKDATCEIRVNTISLDFDFVKAVAYFYGNDSGVAGINTAILRLFSAGYNIENDGSISGSGYLFSAQINYPAPNITPPNGTFTISENPQNFTFLPGKRDGNYLSGTFFYFTGLEGASAILVNGGALKIASGSITGNFTGASGEKIAVEYSGSVQLIDCTLPPPDTIKLNNNIQSYSPVGDVFGNGTNVRRCIIYSENTSNTYLQIDFVVPLGANFIPVGFYRLNTSHSPYSLADSDLANSSGTILFENSTAKEISYGNVDVESTDGNLTLTIHLVDENGRVITGESRAN